MIHNKLKFKYIYGPVPSWRLGSSLGIDPVSQEKKICSFDCIYCQLGKTKLLSDERKFFVPTNAIVEELGLLPPVALDYITFSGAGEPTLAKNLGEMISAVKGLRNDKIAVLTNSSLLHREDVQRDLLLTDLVALKLDACSQMSLEAVDHPLEGIFFDTILRAIKNFKKIYKGKLAIQVMFIQENKKCAKEIAEIIKDVDPDEVQINTPLRPSRAKSLSRKEIAGISDYFRGLKTISVFETEKKEVLPMSSKDTLIRRGKVI